MEMNGCMLGHVAAKDRTSVFKKRASVGLSLRTRPYFVFSSDLTSLRFLVLNLKSKLKKPSTV